MQEFGDIERLNLTRQSVMAYYNWKLFYKKPEKRNTTQHVKLLKICSVPPTCGLCKRRKIS